MGMASRWLSPEERKEIACSLFDVKSQNGSWLNGLNPFKGESNPSFGYNFDKDYYKAHNSSDSGDLIDLYSKVNNYSRRQGFVTFKEEYVGAEDVKRKSEMQRSQVVNVNAVEEAVISQQVFMWDLKPFEPLHYDLLKKKRGWTCEIIREHGICVIRRRTVNGE